MQRIPETLSDEVLGKMHAAPKATDVPVLNDPNTLAGYDAFLLGIPTRYGNFPAQWKVRYAALPTSQSTPQPVSTNAKISIRK